MKKFTICIALTLMAITATVSAQQNQEMFKNVATDVYVLEFFTRPGEFGTIPLSGPYFPIPNVIANNAFTFLGGDFNNSGTLYAFIYQDPDYFLVTINLNTGAGDFAANVSGVVSAQQFLSQLSYNVTNDTYYAMSHDPNNNNGSQLYSVNISTGVLTPVGPLNTIANAIAFEIDNNGVAYAADAVTGNFYTIDLTTGVSTTLGNSAMFGFYPVGQGFSIDHSTNTMYAVLQNRSGIIRSTFYTVNLSNGALTTLGDGSSRKYSLFAIAPEGSLNVNEKILSEITLYPNPSNGNFTIDLGKEYSEVTVRISNMSGAANFF